MGSRPDPDRPTLGLVGLILLFTLHLTVLLSGDVAPDSERAAPVLLSRPRDLPAVNAVGMGWTLDPRTASPETWAAIPGIGPARARSLALLGRSGELRSGADLLRVRGIGPKMAAQLEPWLSFDAPAAGAP